MTYIDALSRLETAGLKPGEKPWCDLVLEITENDSDVEKLRVSAHGDAEGMEVGVAVEWPLRGWREQQPREGLTLYYGRGALASLGRATENLARLYADWFGLPAPAHVLSRWDCAAVGLNSDPSRVFETRASTKFFFEDRRTDDFKFCQLFVNVNLQDGVVDLREKDPEHREALVKFMCGEYVSVAAEWDAKQ